MYALVWRAHHKAGYRRYLREHQMTLHRAVTTHFQSHGTLNLAQMIRLVDAPNDLAVRYLERLEHDGVLRRHGHRQSPVFYTLAG